MTTESIPLRPVEFYILLALCRGETHGYGIINETGRQSDGQVQLDPGTLYRAIARMRDEGLVDEADRREADDLDRRRRRYYAITEKGRHVAELEARRLAGLVRTACEVALIDDTGSAR
jgi:DNA-binding PadR family transcriptional regulator